MPASDAFELVPRQPRGLAYDLRVARFPVAVDAAGLPLLPDRPQDLPLLRCTWVEAARCCNALARAHGLPPAHDEDSGAFLAGDDPAAFLRRPALRLPTPQEWTAAATAWRAGAGDGHLATMRRLYRVPGLDFPTSADQQRCHERGYERGGELVANAVGIHGLLVYAREWCCPCERHAAPAGRLMRWEEYITNYDNAYSHQTRDVEAGAGERWPFRVVGGCGEAAPP